MGRGVNLFRVKTTSLGTRRSEIGDVPEDVGFKTWLNLCVAPSPVKLVVLEFMEFGVSENGRSKVRDRTKDKERV